MDVYVTTYTQVNDAYVNHVYVSGVYFRDVYASIHRDVYVRSRQRCLRRYTSTTFTCVYAERFVLLSCLPVFVLVNQRYI